MSERMYPIPFDKLIRWVKEEYALDRTVFGIRKFYRADPSKVLPIFGEKIVLRILDASQYIRALNTLGVKPHTTKVACFH